jgi:hypothetical protein
MAKFRVSFDVELPEEVFARKSDGTIARGWVEQFLFDILFNRAILETLDNKLNVAVDTNINQTLKEQIAQLYDQELVILHQIEKAFRVEYVDEAKSENHN